MHAKLPKKSASAVQRDGVKLFFMLLPCLIFVFIFSYLPLWGWSYSFFNYKPGKALLDCEFVGWDHFTRLFGNPVLRRQLIMVLRNTLAMAGLGVLFSPLTPVFAICMSELTNRRYRKIVQTLTTLPHFISWTIMYSLVFFMLNVNTGFINNLLVQTGVLDQPVNFLVSQDHVWLTMQGYGLWKGLGWGAIGQGWCIMLSHKNTKNANFLFIVDMLKDLLAQELITDREYARAKKYYMRLTGADIVLVS